MQVSQHQGWTVGHYHFTDLAHADGAAILKSDHLQVDSVLQSLNAFADPLDLKLSWPKTKLRNMGAGDPLSTILIDHGSHAAFFMTDRLQLGWLTTGLDSGSGEALTTWKYIGRVRVCFDPLKCHILSLTTDGDLKSYRGPRQNSKTWVQVTRRRQSS